MISKTYHWTVVGAGPSGIAAVGKLLDCGIPSQDIAWLDPHFRVGDIGGKWGNVPSNTQVSLFLRFLRDCKAFGYAGKFPIDQMDPKENCYLKEIAAPLQWVTNQLKQQVKVFQDVALSLNLINRSWEIKTTHDSIHSKNVILAIGSEAKMLNYPHKETIPLEIALDIEKLTIKPKTTIGVFGSSHSAVLALANLVNAGAHQIINFYRSPHHYALYMEDWILFDNTGLKGYAATWAKQHLDGKHPSNLKRILTSDHSFEEALALCDQVVYAVGFERRKIPVLEQFEETSYNDKTGIIAPGLFGLGIAFPQAKYDPLMNLEHRVGLWKFMDYLNEILPIWLKYGHC